MDLELAERSNHAKREAEDTRLVTRDEEAAQNECDDNDDDATSKQEKKQENGEDLIVVVTDDGSVWWKRARVHMIFLCFLSNLLCYADRANISVAILPMGDEFGWNETTKGSILSAFFVGYILTMFLGGVLATRYGGKYVLLSAVVMWSVFTLLTPIAAQTSVTVLFACRVLMGAGEGLALPAIHSLSDRWFPVNERSRSVAGVTSGHYLGTVFAYMSAPLAAWWWPSVFYGFGAAGLVWAAVFLVYGSSSPSTHRFISKSECAYIVSQTHDANDGAVPWKALVTSSAVWALVAAHVANNWVFYMLLSWIPRYLRSLGVDIANVAVFSFLPWVCCFGASNFSGWLSDHLITKRGLSVVKTRKIMQSVNTLGPAVCLGMLLKTTDVITAVAVLCVALASVAFSHSSFWVNMIDVAPNFAGTVLGFTNTFATVPGIVGGVLTGYILDKTNGDWTWVFVIAIGWCLFGLLMFLVFARGTPQF